LKNVRIQESLTNTSWDVSILQPAQRKVFSTTYVTNEMDLIYKIVSNSLYAESTSPEGYYVSDYQYADVLGLSPSFLDFAVTTVDVFCSEGENAFGYINIEFKEVQTGNYQLTNLTTGISVADSFYQQQWGEIIFHCADNKLEYGKPSTCIWDGTYQGKKIPNGNYSLTLRYKIKDSSEVV